ncbi:MAG: nucleoid occlusion protein [Lactobacillus sp.]|nr:nucleoid occlusion protein [Lactobacillus sp.]
MSIFSFGKHEEEIPKNKQVQDLELAKIVPNQYQPRRTFSDDSIKELAETLASQGLLQPIIVRSHGNGYELIAGERRYRAAKSLGWEKIPAIVDEMDDQKAASLALIENLQRENLNPIDEAKAYSNLMELNDLSQTQLAKEMGKSQSFVANKLRLLKLDPDVQSYLATGKISSRHGRALVGLEPEKQVKALNEILEKDLNVKETEQMVQDFDEYFKKPEKKAKRQRIPKDLSVQINTIKHAVKLAKESGIKVVVHEKRDADNYQITIEMKRK